MKRSKLLLISGRNSSVKEYTISKTKVFFSILILALFSFGIVYFATESYINAKNEAVIASLKQQNKALHNEFFLVDKQITRLRSVLSDIRDLDDQLRLASDIKSIDEDVRNLGVGGTEIDYYLDENLKESTKESFKEKKLSLDEVERQLQFEYSSFKQIYLNVKAKEDSLKYLPSIMPIPEESYKVSRRFSYNMFHPILKRQRPHKGIDIGCDEGTPIYAAADGIVEYAATNGGYGKYVKISHRTKTRDYGYSTRYAHMSKIHVKRGQTVKRGDIIGEVGSTGLSTAPHLHYEVRFKNKAIKPDEYYYVNIN